MQAHAKTPKPFSIATLATRWGVSKPTVHNMIEDGRIENTFKVGTMFRIPAWEVERIESCGTQNQNCTETSTMPVKAQAPKQKESLSTPINMLWR